MRFERALAKCQEGMITTEYAVGTVAACSFACVLLKLLTNWRSMLVEIFTKILEIHFGPIFRIPW